MRVTRIAYTQADTEAMRHVTDDVWLPDGWSTAAEDISEFAGRNCYQSWDKPNPATATAASYNAHIREIGHESVFEHATVSFHIADISRSCSHEMVRHRHGSYSQLSQRYVAEEKSPIVFPPVVRDLDDPELDNIIYAAENLARQGYERMVERLILVHGLGRKDARSAARCLLPNMWSTQIVMTMNHRGWRQFLRQRLAPGADAEIRELAQIILSELRYVAPSLYADFPEVSE